MRNKDLDRFFELLYLLLTISVPVSTIGNGVTIDNTSFEAH